MDKTRFVYTTYISVKPEKVWDSLISPKMTARYWQHENVSDWQPGSRWEHRRCDKDGTLDIVGTVVDFTRPRRLELSWAFPKDEARRERYSHVTIQIEPHHGVSRVTVTHAGLVPGSEMYDGVSEGWPMVLASLKSLLETGQPMPELWEKPAPAEHAETAGKVKGCKP